MPTDVSETTTKDVLYPDDLRGDTLEIDPRGEMNGAVQMWTAEECPADGAKKGHYFPVDSAEHGETWAAAPRDLREQLAELDPGDIFEVLSMEKSGQGETDEWLCEISVITGDT